MKKFLSESNTQLTNLKKDWDALKVKHDALADSMIAQAKVMSTFMDDVKDFVNSVVGKKGFVAELNCSFLKDNFKRMRQSLCISLVPPLFWFSFFLSLVGCCGCYAIPCTYYLNVNLAVKGDPKKDGNKAQQKGKYTNKQ